MFKTYRGNDELIKSWLKRASEEYPVQSVNQALQLILARKMTIGTKAPSTCQVKASLIKTKAFNIDESIAENFFKHLTHPDGYRVEQTQKSHTKSFDLFLQGYYYLSWSEPGPPTSQSSPSNSSNALTRMNEYEVVIVFLLLFSSMYERRYRYARVFVGKYLRRISRGNGCISVRIRIFFVLRHRITCNLNSQRSALVKKFSSIAIGFCEKVRRT